MGCVFANAGACQKPRHVEIFIKFQSRLMRDEKIAGTALLNELYIDGWVVYMTLAKEVLTRVLESRVPELEWRFANICFYY
jgi:hypothetical protein